MANKIKDNFKNILNNGVFYTNEELVLKTISYIQKQIIQKNKNKTNYVFLDLGCGDGSFSLKFASFFADYKVIAVDKDKKAIANLNKLKKELKLNNLVIFYEDVLNVLDRNNYRIKEDDVLIVIGNPPYNNMFSLYQKNNKDASYNFNPLIKARDLGLMFLNVINVLKADYVCVLHPFSYLIKKTNFKSCKFYAHYILNYGYLFESTLFDALKNKQSFCVGLFCYERHKNDVIKNDTYEKVLDFNYEVRKNEKEILSFIPSHLCTITNTFKGLKKYPNHKKYQNIDLKSNDFIFFYTLRDFNALNRNQTFLKNVSSNAIILNKKTDDLLPYYWCDFLKRNQKAVFKKLKDIYFVLSNFDVFCLKNIEDKKETVFLSKTNKTINDALLKEIKIENILK